MASKNKIAEILGVIKVNYPWAKETDIVLQANVWSKMFADISDELLGAAFYQALKTCKNPPTIADIFENITSLESSIDDSSEMLWNDLLPVLKKVHDLSYKFRDTFEGPEGFRTVGEFYRHQVKLGFDKLPQVVQLFFNNSDHSLIDLARIYHDKEALEWKRKEFLKAVPVLRKRVSNSFTMQQIESYQKGLLDVKKSLE